MEKKLDEGKDEDPKIRWFLGSSAISYPSGSVTLIMALKILENPTLQL